jgi:urate oxidase
LYTIPLPEALNLDSLASIAKKVNFPAIANKVRTATLEVIATDESASVQATLYKSGQRVLRECPAIYEIHYSLPNKHYIPVNLTPFKLDNGLGYEGGAEVFHPAADPSGLIEGTITRSARSKL